jgi:hypothetical protein
MNRPVWTLLMLVEIAIASILGWRPLLSALTIANTRTEVFGPNAWYFAGMLFGDFLKLAIPIFLIVHAVWIVRRRLTAETLG